MNEAMLRRLEDLRDELAGLDIEEPRPDYLRGVLVGDFDMLISSVRSLLSEHPKQERFA